MLIHQRLAPASQMLDPGPMRGGGLARGEVGAFERGPAPPLEPLALAALDRGHALGQRARWRHAEPLLGGQRAEQIVLARGDDVRGPGLRERGLEVARHQRVLAAGRRLHVERVEQLALPHPRRHEHAVMPQREPRESGARLDPHPARNALDRTAQLRVLALERLRVARDDERAHAQGHRGAAEMAIGHRDRVVTVHHEDGLLDQRFADAVAPHRPRLEPELLDGRRGRRPLPGAEQVRGKVETPGIGSQALVELQEQGVKQAMRSGRGQQSVRPAGVGAGHGARGRPANTICDKPFPVDRRVETEQDVLSNAHAGHHITAGPPRHLRHGL